MKYLIALILLGLIINGAAQHLRAPIAAEVKMYNGAPTIMLNGTPYNPMIYALTDVPGGRWSWEELPRYNIQAFYNAGIRLVQVDLFLDHIWKQDGSINIDTAKMQLQGVMNVAPEAAIFIRLHVNPPKWWQYSHPEENTVYADTTAMADYTQGLHRLIQNDEKTIQRYSLASGKWKAAAGEKIASFLQKLQHIPQAGHIAAIQVAGGVYGEWHYWGFLDNEPDISLPMQAYFKTWLAKKYVTDAALKQAWGDNTVTLANAAIPGVEERRKTSDGIFRNPQQERKVIDYYEAQHTCVADDILYFCKLVKTNWPRPIITSAFYGYFYAVFGREAAGGHLELQRVLNSPYIDFLCGPNAYYPESKETGEPYRSRSLINSVALHGKLWLDEMDQQPPLLSPFDTAYKTALAKSIANVRRNVLFTFSKGMGLWFYDFGPAGFNGGPRLNDHGVQGWWDDPNLLHDISLLKKTLDSAMRVPYKTDADVLLVHSTEALYYTGSSKKVSYMGHWANNWVPPAVFKSGAVHDVIDINDLGKVNLAQYKAIVFVNTWALTNAQKQLVAEASAGNRHVVFIYAPGYSDEHTNNADNITNITGIHITQLQQQRPTSITINNNILPQTRLKVWDNAINPFFVVDDKEAVPLGTLSDSSAVTFARKYFDNHTAWYISLPPASPALWRYIFTQAGANIYDDKGDIFYNGRGLLSIHTLTGGARVIHLKNGATVNLTLPANSTTVLDAGTGRVVLE